MTGQEREALRIAATWVETHFPERAGQPDVDQTRAMYARWLATVMRREVAAEEAQQG